MTKEEVQIAIGIDNSAIKSGLAEAKAQVREFGNEAISTLKSLKKDIKTLKLFTVVDKVVDALTPATLAISEFFGKLSSGGFEADFRLQHLAKTTDKVTAELRSMRLEGEKTAKTLKELDAKMAKERRDNEFENASKQERVNMLFKEQNEIVKKMENPVRTEIEKAQLKLELIKKQGDLSKALKELDKERLELEKEETREIARQAEQANKLSDIDEEIQDTLERIDKEELDFGKKKLAAYQPTVAEIASSRSWFSFDAKNLIRAQERARNDLLLYGLDVETKRKIDFAESLKAPLVKAGLLGPQETIAEATKASEKHLSDLVRKHDMLLDEIKGND